MYTGSFYDNDEKSTYWYVNDVLHREDGPAVEFDNGTKYWYLKGIRHRIDGPAMVFSNIPLVEWYVAGVNMKEEQFNLLPRNNLGKIHSDLPISIIERLSDEPCFIYVLNGIPFSKEEFNSIQLNKELKYNSIKASKIKI